jgi:hypothetical protein
MEKTLWDSITEMLEETPAPDRDFSVGVVDKTTGRITDLSGNPLRGLDLLLVGNWQYTDNNETNV